MMLKSWLYLDVMGMDLKLLNPYLEWGLSGASNPIEVPPGFKDPIKLDREFYIHGNRIWAPNRKTALKIYSHTKENRTNGRK